MRDKREKNWLWVENDLIDNPNYTTNEKLLYICLVRHLNNKTGFAFPGLETLKREMCIKDSRTLVKICKSLENKKLISIEKVKGKSNRYYIHNVPEYKKEVVTKNVGTFDVVGTSDATGVVTFDAESSDIGCYSNYTITRQNNNKTNIDNSQPPLVQQMLNKYNSLNFKKYEIVPSSKVFTDANNALGTKKLFEALEIMSRSSWVRENMSIESIFKTDNLKKALNGAYRADKEEIKPVKLKVAKEVDEWEEWKNDRV